jgi:phosphoserine phosphatase
MYSLTLVCPPSSDALSDPWLSDLARMLEGEIVWLQEGVAADIVGLREDVQEKLPSTIGSRPIDWYLQKAATRRKALLISDMDSTIIEQECIDELADMVGVRDEVSAITERAMQGELDFTASLIARVALLKGLPMTTLERVWEERITFSKGARELVQTMRLQGARTLLVSGGFTFFTSRVAEKVGFDAHHANTLEMHEGFLTGRVIPPVLDKEAKSRLLMEAVTSHALPLYATVAIGDGANDADMICTAGLGVAYRAKPLLQSQADASITHTDLTTLLYFQGYQFVDGAFRYQL